MTCYEDRCPTVEGIHSGFLNIATPDMIVDLANRIFLTSNSHQAGDMNYGQNPNFRQENIKFKLALKVQFYLKLSIDGTLF